MRSALAIIVSLVVILSAAVFASRAFKSSGVAPQADDSQIAAKAGMDYLLHLRQEGQLPWVTTNQHGNASISGRLSGYPYSFTMQFGAEGETVTNHYNIGQTMKDSPWQLNRAWQTDTNGQIIQEWLLK